MSLSRVKNQLLAKVFTLVPSLAAKWADKLEQNDAEVPFTRPARKLSEAKVALVTTGGLHLAHQSPFDMEDKDGDPSFWEVPVDAERSKLVITHDYYNHADAEGDVNLILPVDPLNTLVEKGVVGSLNPVAYSFMGHIDGPHISTLINHSAARVARLLKEQEVDYALLVPA